MTVEPARSDKGTMMRSGSSHLPGYSGLSPQFHYQPGECMGTLPPDPSVQRNPASSLPHPTDPPREGHLTLSGQTVPPWPNRGAGNSVTFAKDNKGPAGSQEELIGQQLDNKELTHQSIHPGTRDGIAQVPDWYQQNPGPVPLHQTFSATYRKRPPIESPTSLQRKAITGYTGYIPRSAWSIGVGYRPRVQQCMDEFDHGQVLRCVTGREGRWKPCYWPQAHIYSPMGVLPNYTGFIPGSRDCFGETLGNTSRHLYHHCHAREPKPTCTKNAFNERNVLYNW
ncbi:protein FAM166A-like isoform X1 [Xenopus tropicalis]|uniref:Protein FAM166A-like n=1 Tax=Xenopus tropicalis TaxID=8364 RepID=A0A1B8Y043_XENTR|nr:protein FAM166A-like isoform X1 [Xenopus tropicalis]